MEPPELQMAAHGIASVVNLSMAIDTEAVKHLLQEAGRSHAIMPIMDPTRYRREAAGLEASERVLRAFLDFQKVVLENRNTQ